MVRRVCVVLIFCWLVCGAYGADVYCKDQKGKNVDWFVAYKLPKILRTDNITESGVRFYYLDANNPDFKPSPVPISGKNQAVFYTLQQLYEDRESKTVMSLMYNDETPAGPKSFTRGHTKGVVAFGAEAGFWLVHSVPKFPPADRYEYPSTGMRYGQSFLCMSLPTRENLDKVLGQLLIMYPYIYGSNVPQPFSTNAKIRQLLRGRHNKTADNLVPLTATRGQKFYSFAKSKEFNQDLYSKWLAPWLSTGVYTETWMNGKDALPSYCQGPYWVENVKIVDFGGKLNFKTTHDHSKWALAGKKPWVCIGGINRMASQAERCGGTVCFKNARVNKAFKRIVKAVDTCPKVEVVSDSDSEFEQL